MSRSATHASLAQLGEEVVGIRSAHEYYVVGGNFPQDDPQGRLPASEIDLLTESTPAPDAEQPDPWAD